MSIAKYVLLAWFAIAALLTITTIGQPKKPLTPGIAAISLTLTGVLAWLVVIA